MRKLEQQKTLKSAENLVKKILKSAVKAENFHACILFLFIEY